MCYGISSALSVPTSPNMVKNKNKCSFTGNRNHEPVINAGLDKAQGFFRLGLKKSIKNQNSLNNSLVDHEPPKFK